MTRTITTQSARKLRRIAIATGGIVLAGSLGLAALVPTAIPQRARPIDAPVMPTGNDNTDEIGTLFAFDPESVGLRMGMLENAPRPVVVEDTPDPPVRDVDDPEAPKTLAQRIKFLGTMSVGDKKLALISIDDARQRVVAVGNPLPISDKNVVLQRATDSEIFVSLDSGTPLKIQLEVNPDKQSYTSLGDSLKSTTAPALRGASTPTDQIGRGGRPETFNASAGEGVTDPIERRRQSLQLAVEKGNLTQEQADEIMERQIKNTMQSARRNNPGRSPSQRNPSQN